LTRTNVSDLLDQLLCFDVRSCTQARDTDRIGSFCLANTGSNNVDLGGACTCADKTPDNEGLCGGSRTTCKVHLSCLYVKGSSGKGTCAGKECCDDEQACDANPSLMKSCNGVGTCKKGPYYCRP